MGASILELLASLLTEGEHDGGFNVDTAASLGDEEVLVTVNGTNYAIKAEAF